MKVFKIVCIVTSLLFLFLFFKLLLSPESFVKDLGLQPAIAVSVLGRRASIFMLGLSILLFLSKNLPLSKARQSVCLSTGITLIGLAGMGTYEHLMKSVNNSIFVATTIETILGLSFLIIFLKNRKKKLSNE